MHKFKILKAANDQFRIQFLYNSEVMVWSENYASKASAKNCIELIKKNAPGAATVDVSKDETGSGYRFEIVASKDGEHFVRFKASNGETMVRSETYASKASAKNCIEFREEEWPRCAGGRRNRQRMMMNCRLSIGRGGARLDLAQAAGCFSANSLTSTAYVSIGGMVS